MTYHDHECKYCGALVNRESNYRIDARRSVYEVEYMCGTVLKIEIPGETRWFQQCQGQSERMLDNYGKLPDSW